MVRIFESFNSIDLLCPLANNFSLLTNRKLFKFIEVQVHNPVHVGGLKPCGVHVQAGLVLIPKNLVRLVFYWEASNVLRLLKPAIVKAPSCGTEMLIVVLNLAMLECDVSC
jgi:hypothetical protein